MIENRINPPQKSSAEGREAVSEEFVQGIALIDASNFHAAAFVSSVHMDEILALLEPFAELFVELLLKPFEILFEEGYSLLKRRVRDGDRLTILDLHSPAEQLDPAPPGRSGDEFRSFKRFQHSFTLLQICEIVHPLRPSAQLAHGLSAPQHQYAEQRHFPSPEIQNFAKTMGKLLYAMACTTYTDYKMFVLKCFQRLLHRPLVKLHHRITARFLIARIL
jgi:hypothetical protein